MGRLRGGLSFSGGEQRALFVYKSEAPLEHVEQVRLFRWIDATARLYPEGSETRETLDWIHAVPNGAHVHKATARKLIAEGLKSGILDISCDAPAGDWHGLRVEMKRKGKKPNPNQDRYMNYLDRVGVRREVCYSWQSAARVFIDYLSLDPHAPIYD